MKLKTYVSAYLIFIVILYSGLGFVSVYMNNNQMDTLMQQAERDFHRISASLARDIVVLVGDITLWHSPWIDGSIVESAEDVVRRYSLYYREHGIHISLIHEYVPLYDELTFVQLDGEHFIYIEGTLPGQLFHTGITFRQCITENITEMQNAQRIFLVFAAIISVVAAVVFYFVLTRIFKPLDFVAATSIKIARGEYGERIYVSGNNELSQVANEFNRMAEKIESEITGKQQFIDNFAHEIRTPLTSIFGNAEHMQKALLDEDETIELTGAIMDRTNHMMQIANSLLQLATLREYEPRKTDINVEKLFRGVKETLPLSEHGVRLEYSAKIDTICGQEDLLKSLLLNLCFNGMKASSQGDVITLEAKQRGETVILSVADTGAGIPKDCLARVTEPFFRVDKARSRNKGGVGLGLTLCKQIADVHGAAMSIESSEGIGTTITIEFTST